MGSWGPKGPILVPYGTLVFLLIFSSKLAANEPTLKYLINEDPRLPFSQIFSTLHVEGSKFSP